MDLLDSQTVCAAAPSRSSRELDQFFTRADIAERCAGIAIEEALKRHSNFYWVEPSAGAGAFLRNLPRPRFGIDIAPKDAEVAAGDFLTWSPARHVGRIAVVGNPPFGKNASLAVRFFNKAATFADLIAMVVPKTFQKASTHRKLDPHMRLAREVEIERDAFVFDGGTYDVPTSFQVWVRDATARSLARGPTTHSDFEFTLSASAHFAFQRVGARAGLVSTEGLLKSPQSHYFMRAKSKTVDVRAVLSRIDWEPIKCRTAGNPSIGKGELVAAYAEALR